MWLLKQLSEGGPIYTVFLAQHLPAVRSYYKNYDYCLNWSFEQYHMSDTYMSELRLSQNILMYNPNVLGDPKTYRRTGDSREQLQSCSIQKL